MMNEVVKTQAKAVAVSIGVEAHNVAKNIELFRLTVSSQSHHLVFVAKLRKAEILRHRAVVQPQRMWERDGIVDLHVISARGSPHGAGKISKPIRGQQRAFFERRNKISAREMCLMVLHSMECCGNARGINVEHRGQCLTYAGEFHHYLGAFALERGHAQGIEK